MMLLLGNGGFLFGGLFLLSNIDLDIPHMLAHCIAIFITNIAIV
jgi:hypothetical protein